MSESKRILLVEDEDNIALALTFLIEREGYLIDRVADGHAALAALDHTRPDLVILDAMLPGLSGFGVCQHIRETERLAATRVLMISAAGEDARRRSLAIGADHFLLKPFDTKELRQEVHRLLQEKEDA